MFKKIKFKIAAFAVSSILAFGLTPICHADPLVQRTPLGFCSLSSMSAATALSSCSGGIPLNANYALICAYTQGVVWRDDGTAPTGTPGVGGQGVSAGQCFEYSSTLLKIQFIQQNSGAVLGVSFYR